MKCLKIPRHYLIYCFSFFAMFLFSLLFFSSSSYAVSDLVFTSTTSNPCNGNCYELGYRYLIYDNPNYMSASFQSCVRLSFSYVNNSWSQYIQSFSKHIVAELPSDGYLLASIQITSNTSCVVTLSDSPGFSSDSPSGSLSISSNGTYDVTNYSEAVVDVPPVLGDYHDDLVSIKISIIMCAGVLLVLYFFYCIYRLLIKSTGGWR